MQMQGLEEDVKYFFTAVDPTAAARRTWRWWRGVDRGQVFYCRFGRVTRDGSGD